MFQIKNQSKTSFAGVSILIMSGLCGLILIWTGAVACAGPGNQKWVCNTSNGKVHWRYVDPGMGGNMRTFAVSPHDPKLIISSVDMGNTFLSRDGGKTWKTVGKNGARPSYGNPTATYQVCFDPKNKNIIWLAGTQGVFRSKDAGETWECVFKDGWQFYCGLAIDPDDSRIIYAGQGDAFPARCPWPDFGKLSKSRDGGLNWSDISPTNMPAEDRKGNNWLKILIDPTSKVLPGEGHSRVFAISIPGLYVSEDAGATWENLERYLPGNNKNIYRHKDGMGALCCLDLVPTKDGPVLFAGIQAHYADDSKMIIGGIYKSTDLGRSWTACNKGFEEALPSIIQNGHGMWWALNFYLTVCKSHPEIMYCKPPYLQAVFKSEDGGKSWTQCLFSTYREEIRKDADGIDCGLGWSSADGPNNIVRQHSGWGLRSTVGISCAPTDPNIVGLAVPGLLMTTDGGKTWFLQLEFGKRFMPNEKLEQLFPGSIGSPTPYTHLTRSTGQHQLVPQHVAVDPFDDRTFAIAHEDLAGVSITRDNGEWWQWGWYGGNFALRGSPKCIIYDPEVKGRMWVGCGLYKAHGNVYQSDDGGRSFRVMGPPELNPRDVPQPYRYHNVSHLALVPIPKGKRTLFASTDMGLFRTTDFGASWEKVNLAEGYPYPFKVVVDAQNPNRIYALAGKEMFGMTGGAGGPINMRILRSDDGGNTWKLLDNAKEVGYSGFSICQATGTLYMVNRGDDKTSRLMRSDDAGETWKQVIRWGIPITGLEAIAVHPENPDRIYAATRSGMAAKYIDNDEANKLMNVHRSLDGGKTWETIADEVPLYFGDNAWIIFDVNPRTKKIRSFVLHNAGTLEFTEEK